MKPGDERWHVWELRSGAGRDYVLVYRQEDDGRWCGLLSRWVSPAACDAAQVPTGCRMSAPSAGELLHRAGTWVRKEARGM
jgi:hypothetical protein